MLKDETGRYRKEEREGGEEKKVAVENRERQREGRGGKEEKRGG